METIEDRTIAGIIAGLGGNVMKMAIEHTARAAGLTRETGMKKAAGFFLSPTMVETPKGKFIGFIADTTVALMLGIFGSYVLFVTGRDYHGIKGLALGHMSWSAMYGIMARLGATSIKASDPDTYLISLLSHSVFGIGKTFLLTRIGDANLFQPPVLTQQSGWENLEKPMPRKIEKRHIVRGNLH